MGVTKVKVNGSWQKTPEYRSWSHMKNRCLNKNCSAYKYYGGRGIKVYEPWLKDFSAFLEELGPRPDGHSLDRINVNGNYEPGNVRWASRSTQARNKRMRVDNTSGTPGISLLNSGKYVVSVHIGTYDTLQEAQENKARATMALAEGGIYE